MSRVRRLLLVVAAVFVTVGAAVVSQPSQDVGTYAGDYMLHD